jgi:hypothetical protein
VVTSRDQQPLVERNGPARDTLGERRSVDQLEDERGDAARVFEAVDAADVRVVQRREDLRFASKARHAFGIVRERRRQDVHRDIAMERGVAPPLDLAHLANPELGEHFVGAETGSWYQRHGLGAGL